MKHNTLTNHPDFTANITCSLETIGLVTALVAALENKGDWAIECPDTIRHLPDAIRAVRKAVTNQLIARQSKYSDWSEADKKFLMSFSEMPFHLEQMNQGHVDLVDAAEGMLEALEFGSFEQLESAKTDLEKVVSKGKKDESGDYWDFSKWILHLNHLLVSAVSVSGGTIEVPASVYIKNFDDIILSTSVNERSSVVLSIEEDTDDDIAS